jgi:hypothetical protein
MADETDAFGSEVKGVNITHIPRILAPVSI